MVATLDLLRLIGNSQRNPIYCSSWNLWRFQKCFVVIVKPQLQLFLKTHKVVQKTLKKNTNVHIHRYFKKNLFSSKVEENAKLISFWNWKNFKRVGLLPLLKFTTDSNKKISICVKGSSIRSSEKKYHNSLGIDLSSKFLLFFPFLENRAQKAGKALLDNRISIFGSTLYLITDRGTAYCTIEITNLCSLYKAPHSPLTSFSPLKMDL